MQKMLRFNILISINFIDLKFQFLFLKLKIVLGSNELLHKNYITLKPWLRNGLLTNSGNSWRKKRKLLTPAFHFKILGSFKEPMEQKCNILISKLSDVADGRPIDIYQYVTLFALDVISGERILSYCHLCNVFIIYDKFKFVCYRNCNGSKSTCSRKK